LNLKNVLISGAGILALLYLSGCEAPPPPPTPPPPPLDNVVLITIDTVGAEAFFSERIEDPLAQRLSSAQRYLNASSVASWTIPAVATALTGLYPVQHNAGQFENKVANLATDLPSSLSDSAVTLAEMLNEYQFRTGAVSAHPWFTAGFGLEQGFQQLHARKGWQKIVDKFGVWLDQPKNGKRPNKQQATGQALKPQRFFTYLHFMEAHDWHLKSPQELDARMANVDPTLRNQLLADASSAACTDENSEICQRNMVHNLAVRELRGAIDAVLKKLEDRDLLNNTLVVVYSDHGEEFWEHKTQHEQRGDPRNIYGFGHGHSLYQELLHVPLVVWHPGIKGTNRDDLVSLVDIVPSILNWLGLEHSGETLPGELLPAGRDETRKDSDPRVVFASGIAYGAEAIAVREGPLKSIMYYPDENFQYFDLSLDPAELKPLKSDQLTMRFDVLTGDYIDLRKRSLGSRPELDSKTLEHLKSIGYLQGVEEKPTQETSKKVDKKPTEETGKESDKPARTDSPEL